MSQSRGLDRLTGRVRQEAEARVDKVRSAALTAAGTLRTTIVASASAGLVAWFVLFGVRIGSGASWIIAGVVVLVVVLIPAFALWVLRRQFVFIAGLPDQLGDLAAQVADSTDSTELKERFDALSGKRGLRLALAIGSLFRWARGKVDLPSTAAAAGQLSRMVATVPLATGIGVIGTIAVVLLIPVFALASAVLAIG